MLRTALRYFFLLCIYCPQAKSQKLNDTVSVYFPFNISTISTKEKYKLDSLLYAEVLDIGKDLLIIGYADYVGTNLYNDTLSRKRALQVQNYLLTLGYKKDQIKLCIGKGEIEREYISDNIGKGYAPDRRVDIVMKSHPLKHPKPVAATAHPTPVVKDKPVTVARKVEYVNSVEPVLEVKKYLDDIMDVEINEAIVLNHIFFPPNSHYITPNSRAELDNLLKLMKDHPKLTIRIEGHICCVTLFPDAYDEDEQDYHLSINRAKFIYDYLVSNKIDESRMSFVGYGRRRPIVVKELSEIDMQKNRRVEIRVLSK